MGTLDALNTLVRAGLIRVGASGQDANYRIRHVLIREVAYRSVLRDDRRRLHLIVGETLERVHADEQTLVASELAEHFTQAEDLSRAFRYHLMAGDHAGHQYAHKEALEHYRRALEMADQAGATANQVIRAYLNRGRVLELSSKYEEALANYSELEERARDENDRPMELSAVMAQVTLHSTLTSVYDADRAEELAERSIAMARDLDDKRAEAKQLWNLSLLYRHTKRLSDAVEAGERSLALARELDLHEQKAYTLHDLAAARMFLGALDQAEAGFQEVGELWKQLDNRPMLADSLSGLSQIYSITGDYDRALALGRRAFEIASSIDNLWGQANSLGGNRGWIHWDMGRPDKAIAEMRENVRVSEAVGHTGSQVLSTTFLGLVFGGLGAVERGLDLVSEAREVAGASGIGLALELIFGVLAQLHLWNDNLAQAETAIKRGEKAGEEIGGTIFTPWPRLVLGQLMLRQGNSSRAISVMEELSNDVREIGARSILPEILYLQGQALRADGQIEVAFQQLASAREEAERIGSRRMLWQIMGALAEVEATRGSEDQGDALLGQARAIVEEIAEWAPTSSLRSSFLARPDVREVLNRGGRGDQ